MENLVDLLPLLFIGLYYLLAGRRRAKQKAAARQRTEAPQDALITSESTASRPPGSGDPSGPTPFEAFLGQLEDAMAEANGIDREELPAPEPVPPARLAEPVTKSPPKSVEFHAPVGSFDAIAPVDHEAHGFGAQNPLSEESFEHVPAFVEPARSRSREFDPHGLRKAPTPPRRRNFWRDRLHDPQTARDAFVLQTLFGPRGGRHGDRRGRPR